MLDPVGDQRRIGLTGGIATGKSTVARLLSEGFGCPVLDADLFAREALAPGSPAAAAVLARYGKRVEACGAADLAPENESTPGISREALARIVFADPQERRWLERQIHPFVRQRFVDELARLSGEPVVVLVIPLLYEAGLESLCSEVWLVDCGEDQQLRRLMVRDGLDEARALERIHAQWPLERKRALADVLIDNHGGGEPLMKQLQGLMISPGE